MLTLNDFNYHLPSTSIAHSPSLKRDHSRLLVFRRQTQTWSHHHFYQLPQILEQQKKHYLIIRNNSQVIPARLLTHKNTGGKIEVLLIRPLQQNNHTQIWQCLTKPALKIQQTINFPSPFNLQATCLAQDNFTRTLQFACSPHVFQKFLLQTGKTPIPPYIKNSLPEDKLRQVYQTIYARHPGSVAAPTAGLHFTPSLINALKTSGHDFADVTLHIGLGTFLNVKSQNLTQHQMHSEKFIIKPTALKKIKSALNSHQPILAIGTTATRVLESIPSPFPPITHHFKGETSIFLYPPTKFRHTHALITNFHLPKSTLLMLTSAFTSHPNSQEKFTTWNTSPLAQAYHEAIINHYRFFSFGDAMLIL